MQAEQQARSQHGSIEGLVRGRALERIGEAKPQIALLDHVEQIGHRPFRLQLGLDPDDVVGVWLGVERSQPDPALAPSLYQSDINVARYPGVENAEFRAHLRL